MKSLKFIACLLLVIILVVPMFASAETESKTSLQICYRYEGTPCANLAIYTYVNGELAQYYDQTHNKKEIVAKVAEKNGAPKKAVSIALDQMIKQGYLYRNESGKKNSKNAPLKADWQKLENDGIWEQP